MAELADQGAGRNAANWIAVDWADGPEPGAPGSIVGVGSLGHAAGGALRLWAMNGDRMIARRQTDPSAAGTPVVADARAQALPPALSHALAHALEGWDAVGPQVPVLISGPAAWGSVRDAAGTVPLRPTQRPLRLDDMGTRAAWLMGGIRQSTPADTMRAVPEIAGVLASHPHFDGVVCLTGAHVVWVRVSAGEVCHFQRYPTGALMTHLRGRGALPGAQLVDAEDHPDFGDALDEALSRPQRGYGALLRLQSLPADQAGAGMAGALIGIEMADARPYWLGQQVAVMGPPAMTGIYAAALERQGISVLRPESEVALLAGMYREWREVG